jgi:glycerol-1-phosphate dehydrogenase [NAD(P)+]
MEVSGTSRPASGSEHLISHAYDQVASKPSMHGLQVGVAALGTMWLQHNPHRDTVLQVFKQTGFTDFMGEHKLDRTAFLEAIRLAPSVKPGYYTVLSQPGALATLLEYVESDPCWDAYLE